MSFNSFLFSIFICLCPILLHSQNNYKDVVYLKNGEIRKGIIVERIPSESLKIKTSDGNVFVYKMADISKISKEFIQENITVSNKPKYNTINKFNFNSDKKITQIDFGYDFGRIQSYVIGGVQTPSNMGRFKLNIIRSRKINPMFSLGFGTGLRLYLVSNEYFLLPLFAHNRIKFSKHKLFNSKIIPYAEVSTGVSIGLFNGPSIAGLLINPIIGVSYNLSSKIDLNFGIGYDFQGLPYSYFYPYNQRTQIHSFALIIGATF